MRTNGSSPMSLEKWYEVMTEERTATDHDHPFLELDEVDLTPKEFQDLLGNLKKAVEGTKRESTLYPILVSHFSFS